MIMSPALSVRQSTTTKKSLPWQEPITVRRFSYYKQC